MQQSLSSDNGGWAMRGSLSVLAGGLSESNQPKKQEPFVQVYSALVRCKELSHLALRVYLLLNDYAWGDKQECNPSQVGIAEILGVSDRHIRRALAELEDFSLIEVRPGAGLGRNTYKLNRTVVHEARESSLSAPTGQKRPDNKDKKDRTIRTPVSYESHDHINHTDSYTQAAPVVVCELPQKDLDPWDSSEPDTLPQAAPSPDKRKEEFTELLKAARVAPGRVGALVTSAINAGRDADYIRRVIASSLKKDNPPGWVAFMIASNGEPLQPGGGPAVPGVKRDFFVGLGNFAHVVEQTRLAKWAAVIDHEESEDD